MTEPAVPVSVEPANRAAWIPAAHAPLAVAPAPYPHPGEGQIVLRTRAVAVNPVDWIIQVAGKLAYRWLRYPTVLGSDVAGDVVEVGAGATRFAVGDRVIGTAVGTDKDSNSAAEGAFQHYTVVNERMTAHVPDTLAYEQAAVLPLAVSTAATALFQTDQLNLAHPRLDPVPAGATVLIWGGSTSVGTQAIQLAVAAGYDVVATSSPRNFAYVQSLGAAHVFDYNSVAVVDDIVAALTDRNVAGAIAIGTTGATGCARVLARCRGRKFISIATPPISFEGLAPEHRTRLTALRTASQLITSNIALQLRARTRGVALKYIWGTSLKSNEVSDAIFADYLPAALAAGRHRALPEPRVVGASLSDIQHALDIQRRGVSATKVVVTLSPTR